MFEENDKMTPDILKQTVFSNYIENIYIIYNYEIYTSTVTKVFY